MLFGSKKRNLSTYFVWWGVICFLNSCTFPSTRNSWISSPVVVLPFWTYEISSLISPSLLDGARSRNLSSSSLIHHKHPPFISLVGFKTWWRPTSPVHARKHELPVFVHGGGSSSLMGRIVLFWRINFVALLIYPLWHPTFDSVYKGASHTSLRADGVTPTDRKRLQKLSYGEAQSSGRIVSDVPCLPPTRPST